MAGIFSDLRQVEERKRNEFVSNYMIHLPVELTSSNIKSDFICYLIIFLLGFQEEIAFCEIVVLNSKDNLPKITPKDIDGKF